MSKVVDGLTEERHVTLADTVFYVAAVHELTLLRLTAANDALDAGAFNSLLMLVLLHCMDGSHDVIR